MEGSGMKLLGGFRVVQIGDGLAVAVCGRLLADVGAEVSCVDPDNSMPLATYLNHDKQTDPAAAQSALKTADLIICEGQPRDLRLRQSDAESLRRRNARTALVFISPFGQTGPQADDPAS